VNTIAILFNGNIFADIHGFEWFHIEKEIIVASFLSNLTKERGI